MNAKYTRDLILTDSAIWVDARAYSTIADAVAAISNKYQTLLITESVSSADLTIHANTTLKFTNNGFINDSGTLTINTKDIISKDRQIFSAVTNIVFATGSIIRSPWLGSDLAINQSDITILIPSDTVTTTSLSTIDSNIIVEDGGQLAIDEDVTVNGNLESKGNTSGVVAFDAVGGDEELTINGGLTAGLWLIFESSLTISITKGGVVYPEWFGKNTTPGTTDMSTTLQAAVDSLPGTVGNRGVVWLTGNYGVLYQTANNRDDYPGAMGNGDTSCAIVMENYVSFEGQGRLTLLDDPGHSYWAWALFGTKTDVKITGFTIDGIEVDGSATGSTQKLIMLEEFDTLTVINNLFKNVSLPRLGHSDVEIYSSQYKLSNNRLDSTNTGGLYYVQDIEVSGNVSISPIAEFIDLQAGCRRFVISDNVLETDGGDGAIEANASSYGTITGNTIKATEQRKGILINAKAIPPGTLVNVPSTHITISNNLIYSESNGIAIRDNIDVDGFCGISDISVVGNVVKGNGDPDVWGIEVRGGKNITVANNIVHDFSRGIGHLEAFDFTETGEINISSNDVRNCPRGGIILRNPTSIKINYNTIKSCGGAGDDSYNGIFLYALGAGAEDRQIIGNIIDDGYHGIRISGTADGILIIRDNILSGSYTGSPIRFPTASIDNIYGERVAVKFGTIGAGTNDERPIFYAERNSEIIRWKAVNASNITRNNTDYITFSLLNKGSGGSDNNVIAATTTKEPNGSDRLNVDAFIPTKMNPDTALDGTHRLIDADVAVSMKKADSGAGQPTNEMIVILEYLTY